MLNLTVIMPTYKRRERLLKAVNSLTTTAPSVKLIVVAEPGDDISGLPGKAIFCEGYPTAKWLAGAKAARTQWVMIAADDVVFQPGWFEAVNAVDNSGFIGVNDSHHNPQELATHYLINRQFAKTYCGGSPLNPNYKIWYFDVEMSQITKAAGVYACAPDAMVIHEHEVYNQADVDEAYRRGRDWRSIDAALYNERQGKGFPIDYPALW